MQFFDTSNSAYAGDEFYMSPGGVVVSRTCHTDPRRISRTLIIVQKKNRGSSRKVTTLYNQSNQIFNTGSPVNSLGFVQPDVHLP